jgi:hypothetical protein
MCMAFTYPLYLDVPVSSIRLQGELRRADLPHGEPDEPLGEVTQVTESDTFQVQAQGRTTPVRSIGCFSKVTSNYTKRMPADLLVRLEILRIGNSEDTFREPSRLCLPRRERGRTLRAPLQRGSDRIGLARHTSSARLC